MTLSKHSHILITPVSKLHEHKKQLLSEAFSLHLCVCECTHVLLSTLSAIIT
jgi:hypothetical protein